MTSSAALWLRVEELATSVDDVAALRHHGLELVAARAWRSRGHPALEALREDQLAATLRCLAAPELLRRVRAACSGPLMLMKGPEVAASFPEPTMRSFCDLDILIPDPALARRELLQAGFLEIGDRARYEGIHHLRPLVWPGLPLAVELHREVNHPLWLAPPSTANLLRLARPSATGVAGVLAPTPPAHSVLLALHSWAHEPLRRLLDLIDIAAVLDEGDRDVASGLAHAWGCHRVWTTTIAAVDAVLYNGLSAAPKIWARHLGAVRERTVVETHLTRWAGPLSGLPEPGLRALAGATVMFGRAAWPRSGEAWGDAVRRTSLAVGDAFHPQSKHERIRELKAGRSA